MLLSKIGASRPARLWKVYAVWLIFCEIVLILTNAFASQDKIRANGFPALDAALTFGFLVFWGILEAVVAAGLLVLIEVIIEKGVGRRVELPFRLLLTACLVASWVVLLLSIFRIV